MMAVCPQMFSYLGKVTEQPAKLGLPGMWPLNRWFQVMLPLLRASLLVACCMILENNLIDHDLFVTI